MKNILIKIGILFFLQGLLWSCSKESFKEQEQITSPFKKAVTISEIKTLYNDTEIKLSDAFYLEAGVIYTEGNEYFVQDAPGAGLVIRYTGEENSEIKVGSRLKLDIANKMLVREGPYYVVADVELLEVTGEVEAGLTERKIVSLQNEINELSASLISLTKLEITDITTKDGYYLMKLTDETGSINARMPIEEDYQLPPKVDEVKGIFLYVDGNPIVHISDRSAITEVVPEPDLYEKIVKGSGVVLSPAAYNIKELSPGITLLEGSYFNQKNINGDAEGLLVRFHLFELDLEVDGVRLEAVSPSLDMSKALAILTSEMAQVRDDEIKAEGYNVFGTMNGNFNVGGNPAPGLMKYQTMGPLMVNGLMLKDNFEDVDTSRGFFGIKKDGTPIADYQSGFASVQNDLEQVIGGRVILINGTIPTNVKGTRHTRVSFGHANSKIYLFIADLTSTASGADWSAGISIDEMAKILKSVGCESAVYGAGAGNAIAGARNFETGLIDLIGINSKYPGQNGSCDGWLIIGKSAE